MSNPSGSRPPKRDALSLRRAFASCVRRAGWLPGGFGVRILPDPAASYPFERKSERRPLQVRVRCGWLPIGFAVVRDRGNGTLPAIKAEGPDSGLVGSNPALGQLHFPESAGTLLAVVVASGGSQDPGRSRTGQLPAISQNATPDPLFRAASAVGDPRKPGRGRGAFCAIGLDPAVGEHPESSPRGQRGLQVRRWRRRDEDRMADHRRGARRYSELTGGPVAYLLPSFHCRSAARDRGAVQLGRTSIGRPGIDRHRTGGGAMREGTRPPGKPTLSFDDFWYRGDEVECTGDKQCQAAFHNAGCPRIRAAAERWFANGGETR